MRSIRTRITFIIVVAIVLSTGVSTALGIYDVAPATKTVTLRFLDSGLESCKGSIPLNKDSIDLEWQKNIIQRAKEYKRNIVPIYFEGHNSKFFYTLAYIRKLLHIKLNIEMLYLVDEMYGAHGKHFRVHVLPPIPYSTFDSTQSPKQWAQYVKSIVYGSNHTSR